MPAPTRAELNKLLLSVRPPDLLFAVLLAQLMEFAVQCFDVWPYTRVILGAK